MRKNYNNKKIINQKKLFKIVKNLKKSKKKNYNNKWLL